VTKESGVTKEPDMTREPGVAQANLESAAPQKSRQVTWFRKHVIVVIGAVLLGAAAIFAVTRPSTPARVQPAPPMRYLGVYQPDAPASYSGVNHFAQAIGRQPNLVCYYSAWLKPFQPSFAATAAQHGATLLVQINPLNVSLAAIASGQYDAYLRTFADQVRSYRKPVILSFGHEMNGSWYSWGNTRTPPATFKAAWRHIVQQFRSQRANNVSWLWTINIIDTRGGIPAPAPWWPGSSYVNLVGIDGYYFGRSWSFAPLFGPTIRAVHALTRDPILIAETGAGHIAGQSAKIPDLFAGVRAYGLLGFVWFDAVAIQDWRLTSPAAIVAFRRAVKIYERPAS
jgi:mannan endo-1,4-beta-mannosidase